MRRHYTWAAAVLGAAIALGIGGAIVFRPAPELTMIEDPVMTVELTPEEVPLQKDPEKPVVTTQTSTKTSKKKVTTREPADKTYTRNLGTKRHSTTKTAQTSFMKTRTVTDIGVTKTEKYTKGSHIKEVTTKTVTTVTVTKTALLPAQEQEGAQAQVVDLRSLAPMMDDRLLTAFDTLGFKVVDDPSYQNGEGSFDPKNRLITINSSDSTYIYHELGHFLSFIMGNKAGSKDFAKIYKAEKDSFAGTFKVYAKKNSDEFFAECTREYVQNRTKLKGWCPEASKMIRSCLDEITPQLLSSLQTKYKGTWKE